MDCCLIQYEGVVYMDPDHKKAVKKSIYFWGKRRDTCSDL